ncbi:heavy-metal-associated domain-containing protein [uncultured Sphingomonas sp.]|uniref:heavy-metal-associated domain-containing protein n=1 Tax=uncultured Sphingomonas sp. TaxID=158754 RepID=UPI00261E43EC|nr:heavy-metal-associated domain-containing protein [uncultured Sphingomonas sp.]
MTSLTLSRLSHLAPRRWPLLVAASAMVAGGGWYAAAQLAPGDRGVPPIDSSSNYEVTGVTVDVAAKTADEARTAAWREAQRKGWAILWARLHGASPDAAPGLPDSTLDSIVAGIEVEAEQVGPHRYIATLGLLFDRGRTGSFVGGANGQAPRSAPMLVIPIQYGGGSEISFEGRSSWQKAWARFRAGSSPVDYVRPVGTGPDPLLLNLGQSRRPGRIWWRMLLDQYGASDMVVPEVFLERRYPGGPIAARFVARHGPDAEILGGFTLVSASTDGLDRMLDEGVRRIDALYVAALNDGRLRPDPSLTIETPDVPTPDLLPVEADDPLAAIVDQATTTSLTVQLDVADVATLDQAQAALRAVPGVKQATVSSLALGGTSLLAVSYDGDPAALRIALAARGWQIEGEGTTLRMRRGRPTPAPAAPPPPDSPQQ